MTALARQNGHAEATQAVDSSYVVRRKPGPKSQYIGRRVRWVGGPNKGETGVIVAITSGNGYIVRADQGGAIFHPARTSVQLLDDRGDPSGPVTLPGTPRVGLWPDRAPQLGGTDAPTPLARAAARMAHLFATRPEVTRAVVYRTAQGLLIVKPWVEQQVGPGMIGVYGRDVTLEQLIGDVA